MSSRSTSFPLAAILCAVGFVAAAQQPTLPDAAEPDGKAMVAASPMKAALWTDKPGYGSGEQMNLYVSLDSVGDETPRTLYFYRENIETGDRLYLSPLASTPGASTDTRDASGLLMENVTPLPIPRLDRKRIWRANVPDSGLWQFVGEVRNADSRRLVKRAYAKLVVTAQPPADLGFDGHDTEIVTDTTWTNDRIYRIRHQVFVNSGATLTIEPGTLILARGQNALIVVEQGGKIVANGRREAPIVMTCDQPVGLRESGCWGGLIVLGSAPVTQGPGRASAVAPETRPTYGGDDPSDSSGALRYVRVEFAGVNLDSQTRASAFGFHGVGAGTVISHIQAHESGGDGIEFLGGSANCTHCVSSGSKDDSLDWAFGWQGSAQYVFIQQSLQGDNGIEADSDSAGLDQTPRSHPSLYNLTMIGALAQDEDSTSGDGMSIRTGSAITARNVLITGFGGPGLDVRDNSPEFFADGTSSITNSIIHANGASVDATQIAGGIESMVEFMDVEPVLVNVHYEANPDPRPAIGSPALKIGAGATPPSDGMFDTSAKCVGAFCNGENWLEEWTFFGDELDYLIP